MDFSKLNGSDKAAIVLMALGEKAACQIMTQLDSHEINRVGRSMARLEHVPREIVDRVMREYLKKSSDTSGVVGGGKFAQRVISTALDPSKAEELLDSIQSGQYESASNLESGALGYIREADPRTLSSLLKKEHPQVIAVILSHLESGKAAEVLSGLPTRLQVEGMMRMADLDSVTPSILKDIFEEFQEELKAGEVVTGRQLGGSKPVAAIMNVLDSSTEEAVMRMIEETKPEVAEQIRKEMFVFDDLRGLDDRGVQSLLKEINNDDLVLSFKACDEALQEKFYKNMSERAATLIREDLEVMGPKRLSEVEEAQQNILKVARQLIDKGEIFIEGKGGGGEADIMV